MAKHVLNRYIGALQFALLALVFALPLLSQGKVQPLSIKSLNILVEFEFGILIMGWLIAGLLFVPLALAGNWTSRVIAALLALLVTWPLTSAYHGEYGWPGALSVYWLLFANYGAVFVHSPTLYGQRRLLAELGLRAISYPILFMIAAGLFDMPSTVGRWPDSSDTYLFGVTYFGALALFEYRRSYPRTVNLLFGLASGEYQRLPRRDVGYRNEHLRSHVIRHSPAHLWWVFLILGLGVLALVTVFTFASLTEDVPPALMIAIWLFCLPFAVIGALLVLGSIWLSTKYFAARPAWLNLKTEQDNFEGKLYFDGFVPLFDHRLVREPLEPVLKCYLLTFPPHEDEFATAETLVEQVITTGLIESVSRHGTRFQFECALPQIDAKAPGENCKRVWHLQVNVAESMPNRPRLVTKASVPLYKQQQKWSIAFTLPVKQAGGK
ncbi:MAG: hypothetical protein HKN15_11590 [Xanthomonadales bacterium]|nr:hypothetical protein [Xanthomonadales bacterium]